MYNAELKQKFLDAHTGWNEASRTNGYRTFQRAQSTEEKYDCDICRMNHDQFLETVAAASGFRSLSKQAISSFLMAYVRWCASTNVEGAEVTSKTAQYKAAESCKGVLVSGPEHLKEILDIAYGFDSVNKVSVQVRAALWLAFAGVRISDAVNLKATDILLNEQTAITGRGRFHYESIGADNISACVILTCFSTVKNTKEVLLPRAEGNQLLRGLRGELSLDTLKERISRELGAPYKQKKIDTKITYDRILLSGLFWRTYNGEDISHGIQRIYGKAKSAMDETPLRSLTVEKERRFRAKVKLYKKDYQVWLNTFYGNEK